MPEHEVIERARRAKRAGKSASAQAGKFVREEIRRVRQGKHGVRSTKQAIAIGLSKARRSGVKLPPPKKGAASAATRRKAQQDLKRGSDRSRPRSLKRARTVTRALRRESREPASSSALSRQAKAATRNRTPATGSASASRVMRTRAARRKSGC